MNWNLKELVEQAVMNLPHRGESERVKWEPTPRQIRYYTTLNLLDRPLRGSDRTARYTSRHLVQLMAVKRLQHQGLKLKEIGSMLEGLSTGKLVELLGLSQEWLKTVEGAEPENPKAEEFWNERPLIPLPEAKVVQYSQIKIALGLNLTVDQDLLNLNPSECQEFANQVLALWRRFEREN